METCAALCRLWWDASQDQTTKQLSHTCQDQINKQRSHARQDQTVTQLRLNGRQALQNSKTSWLRFKQERC